MNTNKLLATTDRPFLPEAERHLLPSCSNFIRATLLPYYENTISGDIPDMSEFENWGMRAIITSVTDPQSTKKHHRILCTEALRNVQGAAAYLLDPKFNWKSGRKSFKKDFGIDIFLEHSLPVSVAFSEIIALGELLRSPAGNDAVSSILECVNPVWMLATENARLKREWEGFETWPKHFSRVRNNPRFAYTSREIFVTELT